MRRAVKVKPMNNYLLLVRFDNGEERIFNCMSLMQSKLYSELCDKEFFRTVHIDNMGVVCWNDSIDIDPYLLYEDSVPTMEFAFAG